MAAPSIFVVGVDFSETSSLALSDAVALARRGDDAQLHLVAVVESPASGLVPQEDRHASLVQITDHVRERLTAEADRVHSSNPERPLQVFAHVRVGPTAEQIAALALELRADLVVVGTHGRRGVRRLIMGSVAERTMRLAPCPVMVVRPKDFHAMDGLPEIEPACPGCLQTREATQGAHWWCEVHENARSAGRLVAYSGRVDVPPSVSAFRS